MTTYNLTKNDTPKVISCSKKGTPKNGTSRTSLYGSYPPGLKYSQFQELTIRVLDEKGNPPHFLNKIFLVLHCRKKT